MKSRYSFTNEAVVHELTHDTTGEVLNTDLRQLDDFLRQLGRRAPTDTGLLPPGVRSIRQGGAYIQVLVELPPAVELIRWGKTESQLRKPFYSLAMPYRFAAIELMEGSLLGARLFYSPTALYNLEQPVYLPNVPNLNASGYRNTSVGWICLYRTHDTSAQALGATIFTILARLSGAEPYNDNNMRSVDGTRYYQRVGKPKYTWDPTAWEKKTADEGVAWTLDPDLWIPVRVSGPDNQSRCLRDAGQVLTVGMVLTGNSPWYYEDAARPRLYNQLAAGQPMRNPITDIIVPAFTRSARWEEKKAAGGRTATVSCSLCGRRERTKNSYQEYPAIGYVCNSCFKESCAQCTNCEQAHTMADMTYLDDKPYCKECF